MNAENPLAVWARTILAGAQGEGAPLCPGGADG
jgi:hypothetical protein